MVNTIDNVYIQTFENNVRHLAQQTESKVRNYVSERATNGEKHSWERLGEMTASAKGSTRPVDTPIDDAPWSRRVSLTAAYHAGDLVEQEDPVQMLVDPNSNITRALAMAMKRQVDDIILDACTADALNDNEGITTDAFDYTNQSVGDYNEYISFDAVTAVQELFMKNDIDPATPKVAIVGPEEVRRLMQLTEQTSSDYVNAQALQTLNASGIVPNWMGFTWILSTRLNQGGDSGAAGTRDCIFMTHDAMGLQVNRDITARVAEDPSVSFAWRIYCYMTMGAVRVEDEKIVALKTVGSNTPV